MDVISTHNLISNDPQLAQRYLAAKEKAVAHFEDMLIFLRDERQKVCQRRWNTLPYNVNIREYHSPDRMMDALERTPMYKQALQGLKVNWIGFKLSPPLLFSMLEGRKEEEERKKWEEIDKNVGFYP